MNHHPIHYNPLIVRTLFASLLVSALLVAGITSCDETPGASDATAPGPLVSSIAIQPSTITFDPLDGAKDSLIEVTILAQASRLENTDSLPGFILQDLEIQEILTRGTLQPVDGAPDLYGATISLELSTTVNRTLRMYAYLFDEQGRGNRINTGLRVNGFSVSAPTILSVDNPETVEIPEGNNEVTADFTAKVTDVDGQNSINGVFLNFINADGTQLLPNDQRLYDDGGLNNSGDSAAGDSVFTVRFLIDASNSPSNRTVFYYAVDDAGLVSDTVRRPFNLVDNE